jgi:hypothetical protein
MRVESTSVYPLPPGELLVLLVEEYGYGYWLWIPYMTAAELEDWWRELPSVNPYFFDPSGLPGQMCVVHTPEQHAQFDTLRESNHHYTGHIHQDDDSFLARPDKSRIFHQGFQAAS